MTPEEAAAYNRTAPHAAQAHQCRECGRYFTGPGAAGWRQGPDGVAYARAGMCSLACVDADLLTSYEPPYPVDRLPGYLRSDPTHRWRAESGIELIHEEPDWDEYQRTHRNWQMMTPEQKSLSDAKSLELFGVDSMTHAKRILPRMLLKRAHKEPTP